MIKRFLIATALMASGKVMAYQETGHASWYGPGFHGKRTASGKRFDRHALTAAHKTLPLNSKVKVTNLKNHASVIVTINDRGPHARRRMIDLSQAAAKAIGLKGTGPVQITALEELGPSEIYDD